MNKWHVLKIIGEVSLSIGTGLFSGYLLANQNSSCSLLDVCNKPEAYFIMLGFFCIFGSSVGVFKAVMVNYFTKPEPLLFKASVYCHGITGIIGWVILIFSYSIIFN